MLHSIAITYFGDCFSVNQLWEAKKYHAAYSKQGINPSLQYCWCFRNPANPNNHRLDDEKTTRK